ncbi:MAG: DNA-directed RNA polymerase subunit omega [Andreesenia angusta]|nr:DNA-directed RNA polymerase subunit omega [Andreesenia angusta]
MINLSNEEILKHIDSKYSFVTVISKRARQILEGDSPLIEPDEEQKAISIALKELTEGLYDFHNMDKEEIEALKNSVEMNLEEDKEELEISE